MKKKISIVTHSGSFHPDDCFSVAIFLIYLKRYPVNITVTRTRDEVIIKKADYVADVGGEYDPTRERYDHHQKEVVEARKNGIPYASFGLVWKKYGEKICSSKTIAKVIDEKLVQQVDAADNGIEVAKPIFTDVKPYMLHNVFFSFLPTWNEGSSNDESFFEAVAFAKKLLLREIKIAKDKEEGNKFVLKAYRKTKDKRLIVFDREYLWADQLSKFSEPVLVVYPESGNFHVKTVRNDPSTFKSRMLLPKEWAGKRGEELVRETGVLDAVFCHYKRYIVVAKSQEGAVALAKKALELNSK